MLLRTLAPVLAAAFLLFTPAAAMACSTDQTTYLETFSDTNCLLGSSLSGVAIDGDGGLRLKTAGATTPTVWDTDTQFNNPPSGNVGSLRVVGTGTAATLELPGSQLPLLRQAASGFASGAQFSAGRTQARDSEGVEDPSVIRVGSAYVMYYTGYAEDGATSAVYRLQSVDGTVWTRPAAVGTDPNPAPVLAAGAPGAWDASGVYGADVIYDAADTAAPYRMYYSGFSAGVRAIGYAASQDGITWVKAAGPVLDAGLPGSRDAYAVANPSVLKDGDVYKMYYEGDDSTVKAVGYATSTDGVTWKRAGLPASLQQDPLGGGDPKIRFGIFAPTVWKTPTGFRMIFVGRNANDPTSTRLLGATSADGIDWTIGGPELNPQSTRFYATNFYSPEVLVDPADSSAAFKLYFAGDRAQSTPADDRARIGLATSTAATGNFGFVAGAQPFESVLDVGSDSARFDARAVTGLSVADPLGTDPWVGAYAGVRSDRTSGTVPTPARLGIATYDPAASTPAWTKRDGAQTDQSILASDASDAKGQSDPSLSYQPVAGNTDDWYLFYTATPSVTPPSVRLASSDEDSAGNGHRPTTWTKAASVVLAAASHPALVRQGAGAPALVYHTVEDGTPTSMAVIASTANDTLTGTWGAPSAVSFTGVARCDPDGAADPVVTKIGTTLHMLYTGFDGTQRNTCYATADSSANTVFARQGLVMPPSDEPYSYDERATRPASMFIDADDAAAPLRVYLVGTDRGERRFVGTTGASKEVDRRTRIGLATSALPLAAGSLPSGTATGEVGSVNGPVLDFRTISREVLGGARVEMAMSVLQPYSQPGTEFWSEYFPVNASSALSDSDNLTFRFGVRAARWRARLIPQNPANLPRLDKVTIESGPLQFEGVGRATTTLIGPPDSFNLGSWQNLVVRAETFTVPGGTAGPVTGALTVLAPDDSVLIPTTSLTLSPGADQSIPLAAIPASTNRLKVKFDLTAAGTTPQSTPLIKQLRVTYVSAKATSDRDGDGIADSADACPDQAGPAATQGCPDADGDGVIDSVDKCPTVAGPAATQGCPDADADGVSEPTDTCPTQAAPGSPNGCPVTLTALASRSKIIFGSTVTLSGKESRGSLPVVGEVVTVKAKAVLSTKTVVAGTATTDINGAWKLALKPRLHTTYTVSAPSARIAPAPVTVRVAHRLSLKVACVRRACVFTGALGPSHPTTTTVRLQRKVGTIWRTIARIQASRRGAFRTSRKFARKGTYRFRVTVGADTRHAAGRSRTRSVILR